jgi:hypothetical protein
MRPEASAGEHARIRVLSRSTSAARMVASFGATLAVRQLVVHTSSKSSFRDAHCLVGNEEEARSGYCTLMPASRTTFAHFSISIRISASHSSGGFPTGTYPSAAMRFLISGCAMLVAIAR